MLGALKNCSFPCLLPYHFNLVPLSQGSSNYSPWATDNYLAYRVSWGHCLSCLAADLSQACRLIPGGMCTSVSEYLPLCLSTFLRLRRGPQTMVCQEQTLSFHWNTANFVYLTLLALHFKIVFVSVCVLLQNRICTVCIGIYSQIFLNCSPALQ